MKATIVTPLGKIFDDEIKELVLPGIEGEFGVLDKHAPLTTTLMPGIITVKTDKGEEHIVISGGFVEVSPDNVNILVDEAQALKDGTSHDIADAIENAKKILKDAFGSDAMLASVETKVENIARNL